MKEHNILQVIKKKYNAILQEKLVGIYVHGSIAFGCFHWDKSDIDFLVVVNKPLTQNEKEALISELLSLDEECPAKGLEMSVVLADVCKPFVYPTPFELHFSNFHKERVKADLAEYCKNMNGVDKDLAAHMMVIHAVGITLCGQAIEDVFAPVPKADYIDSIYNDIACAEEDILEDSVYVILNLCRVLAYLRDDRVLSKSQGGEWGLRYLSPKYHPTIRNAMEAYGGLCDFTEKAMLQEFAKDMLENIRGYMNEIPKVQVNDTEYQIIKLLGHGKGGYSYLAEKDGKQYVLKQIHHEPCDYYTFGNKIEAEQNDYQRLEKTGIRIPKMLDIDIEKERILKEYVDGPTIYDLVKADAMKDSYLQQVRTMAKQAYDAGLNIDYFPTNFIVQDEVIYYIDYECNNYMEEWNFENWGIKYWAKTEEFMEYVKEH